MVPLVFDTRALFRFIRLFSVIGGVISASFSTTAELCRQLETTLGDFVVSTVNDADYEALRTENWVQTAWGTPTCIFHPSATEQLQKAVTLLVKGNVSFAVRSGGHEPHHGFANIDNGVLIDMSNFTRLDYDAGRSIATIGAGLRWGDVYTQLQTHGVIAVGGRVLDVGVPGLTLGGGLSWFTDLYGLACDNVVNMQVILADGSIVNANTKENKDLFWALKGGANNFGIVTKFTVTTYPLGQVWGGIKTYATEQLPQLVDAYFEYQSAEHKDPYANLIMAVSPTNASIGALVSMVYLKPEEEPAAFAPFYSINTTSDSTAIKSFTDYLAEYGVPSVPRFDWHATSFKLDKSLYEEVGNIITSSPSVETIKAVTAGFMAITMQPISSGSVEIGRASNEGNALGLEAVNQTWLATATGWWFPNDDQTVHDAGDAIIDQFVAASTSKGDHVPFLFMNDASWDQDVLVSYGEENYKRLKEVQMKYDPNLVFQRLVPGGFKLR
ncbi:putative FAD-binding oxidoreductase [Hypoxylon sp. FL0890]|nr:putative FAD-binding oxidoreductase [Hypoxylon sp. FL0890]